MAKLTEAQTRLLAKIEEGGGAIQRRHLNGHQTAVAWRLVEAGRLVVDGANLSSRGPFNQAAQDTLTFVIVDEAALKNGETGK